MQLKTALLASAVVAALAGLSAYAVRSGDTVRTAAGARADGPVAHAHGVGTAQASAVAAPAHAMPSTAAELRHAAALKALTDTSSRPGARSAWSSGSSEQADRTGAADRARGLLAGVAAREVHLARNDAFNARNITIDRDGTEHVRMERSYRGLPVIGGDMVVHSRDGQLLAINQNANMRTTDRPDIRPGIDAARARAEAASHFDGRVAEIDPGQLVVYARNGVEPTLAYQVDVRGGRRDDQIPGSFSYFLDADDGRLLEAEDHLMAIAGTAKTINLGDVAIDTQWAKGGGYVFGPTGMTIQPDGYKLIDASRGNAQTFDAGNAQSTYSASLAVDADNVWGNNSASDRASVSAEVHYGVAATWDYYKTVFARNGVANNGNGVKSYTHYGQNLVNAFWDFNNSVMYYGDGDPASGYAPLIALDVAGHEMTHGVSYAIAKLQYYNVKDTGGVNESWSDAFGTLVEYSVNNPKDPGDFLIGENVYSKPDGKKALRAMFQQNLDAAENPALPSLKCYPAGGFASQTGQRQVNDPHKTSGVGNLAFYLVAQGAVVPANYPEVAVADLNCGNGDTTIAGLGLAKAGAIWYRAMNLHFTSAIDYPGVRKATLDAASELYGANSTEYRTVARAWSAVNVN
ncbi:M4 family metallopeptidase [Lysobacter sp. K5869]|uniref:M4 family metallopeptidase n=1 Tax=Lysobacter sp. K5869 TaxID=2820808 RepID=UPI001C0621B4|nr:M4 family metallopeptidase [Lysobacter sp. K5869]QWP76301.1 M4 family metallopeptidase [Lysobacter sp. K5869]